MPDFLLSTQQFGTLGQINRSSRGLAGLTRDFSPEQVQRIAALIDRGIDPSSREIEQFDRFIATGEDPGPVNGRPISITPGVPSRTASGLAQRAFFAESTIGFDPSAGRVSGTINQAKTGRISASLKAEASAKAEGFFSGQQTQAAQAGAVPQPSASPAQGITAVASIDDVKQAISGVTGQTSARPRNQLIAQVQAAQRQSVGEQFAALGQAGAGRQAILGASPQLAAASQTLQQQATDPGGGGFRQDFQERIRVQQAAAGLSGGGQAAFQEAALTAGALQQRRLSAGSQLQQLGGRLLGQLGLGAPIVADLAGIGQTQLAGQTFAAIRAANQAQAAFSQQIFDEISGFLNRKEEDRIRPTFTVEGLGSSPENRRRADQPFGTIDFFAPGGGSDRFFENLAKF